MAQIFISYDNSDRTFALRLADSLERFYAVWIDREGLAGGVEWEQEIEQALKDCTVFTVIVSPESNKSDWVARETIRAEQLGKYRIPVVIDGELPLRLLNLQYIDFRADFDGGLRDMLEVLQGHIYPGVRVREETRSLIGAGVMAYLAGDPLTASKIIGQALALDPAIAPSQDAFWEALRARRTTNLAADLLDKIAIVETCKVTTEVSYPDKTAYAWSLALKADNAALSQVDHVVYHMHPTFDPAMITIRSRETFFKFAWVGWGVFNVGIEAHFVDGTSGRLEHMLSFAPD